ncbi:MAG: TorF family putative porin [Mariprofundales bacterium]
MKIISGYFIAMLLAMGIPICVSTPANAVEINGDIGVFSQYVWRGLTQTDGAAAVQGDLVIDTGTGLSATMWFSNTGFASAPQFSPRKQVEFDWVLDYSGSVGNVGYSFGGAYYTYLYGSAGNFAELYGGFSLDAPISPSLTVSYIPSSPLGSAIMDGDMWFDLGIGTAVAGFDTSLTVSYAIYKNDALRTAANFKDGLTVAALGISRDIAVGDASLSPSLSVSLPLASKDALGNNLVYGLAAELEFVAGVNLSY